MNTVTASFSNRDRVC